MEEILKAAKKAVELAKSALRKGWPEMALLRYGQAIGMVQAYLLLSQTQEIELTQEDDVMLIRMIGALERETELIIADWGNGHRNPPRHEIARVGRVMLKDVKEMKDALR